MFTPPPISDPALPLPGVASQRASLRPRGSRLVKVSAILARRPQRQIALVLVAAVTGLVVAATGLFHPAVHDMEAVPLGDVALVNHEPILMSDFVAETQAMTGGTFDDATAAQRAQVLRSMINTELLVQRSLTLDLPEQDTDVRTALMDGVNAAVDAGTLGAPLSDDALRSFYAANRARYGVSGKMSVTDLVLHVGGFENVDQSFGQALADAAQAVYALRSGAEPDYVKQHFGFANSGRAAEEQPDFAAKIHLGSKLFAVAETLSDGEVSNPVSDRDGVHVLIMRHRQPPVFADFDSARNSVYSDYVASRKKSAEQEALKFLRAEAQILVASGESE